MTEAPKRSGWRTMIAAKLVCCGGLVLFATGALTVNGIGTWLLGGATIWLVLGAAAVILWVLWRRQRTGAADTEQAQ